MNPYRVDNESNTTIIKKPWYGWRGFIKLCNFLIEKLIIVIKVVINIFYNLSRHPIPILKFAIKISILCVGFIFLPIILIIQLLRNYGGEPENTKTLCNEIIDKTIANSIEPIHIISGMYCFCFIVTVIGYVLF